ncbi:DUF2752 domain-containing protein [Actinocrinis puniceicyclus]|uniref:DUF2752 domain-containing protein n=1 Tax=Actinocrinis puniceicyclus TaxID=977794 RepID=A0A8J7WGA9_9ACTN|nr:DUF2752 domain-containing protein [Actinocrinis puniceicyclus]MBS2961726.1 DUF2752 domain-containing protein [Actinocrinis puniceicyclus]
MSAAAPRAVSAAVRGPRAAALRLGLVALASVAAAWVHQNHDPGALCPLRRLTGVPCPFCGSTTVFMEAGAGHWGGALAANPLTVAAAVLFLAAPLTTVDPMAALARTPVWLRWTAGALMVAGSWLWQLRRFGFVG